LSKKAKIVVPYYALSQNSLIFPCSSHGTSDNFLLDKVSDMRLLSGVFGNNMLP